MDSSSTYRVIELLKMSTDYLDKKQIDNPRLNSELLLGHVLKMNRVQLYLNFEKPLTGDELDRYRDLLKRRGTHEPIQYILGETEFYSLKLKVNRHTLIPRPETEILVDTAIGQVQKIFDPEKTIEILDVGTGCGNIAIALAKNIERSFVTAIDIHDETLQVAEQNAKFHQVDHKVTFFKQDIFTNNLNLSCKYNMIVSNPPYISQQEFELLPREVRDYEPYISLNGGNDGMNFYRRLATIAKQLLLAQGFIIIEIGASQAKTIKELFSKKSSFRSNEIINDLNGMPRVFLAMT